MSTFFLGIVVFLIVLAIFDLVVGVSNDAVNFLNSAIGAKVAKFRTIVLIAAIGVFAGASMSNGMMDVARHGIMTPEYFSFYDVMCVFLAVMVTDVLRNQLGFHGVVITDAMNMGAVTGTYSSADAAVTAIQAGVDMILMPEDFQSAYQGVMDAVTGGTITEDRINESVARIIKVKLTM